MTINIDQVIKFATKELLMDNDEMIDLREDTIKFLDIDWISKTVLENINVSEKASFYEKLNAIFRDTYMLGYMFAIAEVNETNKEFVTNLKNLVKLSN